MAMDFQLSAEDIQLFLEECDELLQQLEQDLLELESGGDKQLLDQVFRAAHTLKGSAATLGHKEMAEFTHQMEDLLSRLRSGDLDMNREIGDALLASLDILHEYRDEIESGEPRHVQADKLLAEFARLSGAGADAAPASTAGAAEAAAAEQPMSLGDLEVGSPLAVGQIVWKVTVAIDPQGPMPAVRAFQALLAAESWGEVIHSDPSREQIEAEKIGNEVTLLIAGGGNAGGLREALGEVPELTITAFEPAPLEELPGVPAGVTASRPPAPVKQAATVKATPAQGNGAAADQAPAERSQSDPAAARTTARSAGARTVRVNVDLLDNLMNLVGELVIDRTRLTRLVGDLGSDVGDLAAELGQTSSHIGRVTADLQEQIMRVRMLPIENLFRKFPRMVRDLAHAQGKEVELIVRGEDTELDRSIMEEIADPLLHLLRNAVDHGIEPPTERLGAGKDAKGRIWLEAAHEEGSIVITVRDDGRGMNRTRIAAKAVERGMITEEQLQRLDDQDVLELVMKPGFSLAEQVTDVSGRGVGMDVVRSNIERINGTVSLTSTVGEGSEIRIRLPLTLAIIQALLVRVGGETYALPLSAVLEAAVIDPTTIRNVQNQEVMPLRGEVIPLVQLRQLFGLGPGDTEEMSVVVVSAGNRQAGLVVDSLEGEQEIVVKNLGPLAQMTPGLAGATILGDGSVALILDVAALLPSHRNKEESGNGYHLAG